MPIFVHIRSPPRQKTCCSSESNDRRMRQTRRNGVTLQPVGHGIPEPETQDLPARRQVKTVRCQPEPGRHAAVDQQFGDVAESGQLQPTVGGRCWTCSARTIPFRRSRWNRVLPTAIISRGNSGRSRAVPHGNSELAAAAASSNCPRRSAGSFSPAKSFSEREKEGCRNHPQLSADREESPRFIE